MKKKEIGTIILSIILITSVFMFLAGCSNEATNEPESEEFYLIGFTDLSAKDISRGMTTFPDDVPFLAMNTGIPGYNVWLACNAMSALPIIPAFEKVISNPLGYISSIATNEFSGYGFPMKIEKYKVNPDGLFLRYQIFEEEKVIGFIDYYYSWKEKVFSYRELVTPFMDRRHPNYGDNILFFQLYDVPISEGLDGVHFNAGVDSNGGLDPSTSLELIKIEFMHSSPHSSLFVKDYNVLMNFNGSSVASSGYQVTHNYNSVKIFPDDFLGLDSFLNDSENKSKYGYEYADNYVIFTDVSDELCNLDFALDFMTYLFEEGEIEALRDAVNVNSLAAFDSLRLDLNETARSKISPEYTLTHSTKYDFDDMTAATYGPNRDIISTSSTEPSMFSSFYIMYSDIYGNDFAPTRDFAKIHLVQCGLSESAATELIDGSGNYHWNDD